MLVDPALGEDPPADADTAHVQTLPVRGREAPPDDAFRAAAADVDDEAAFAIVGERARHSEVDEPGLFPTGDDLDRMAGNALRLAPEGFTVAGATQRIGAHRSHRMAGHVAQPLPEAAKTGERPLDRIAVQALVRVEPRGETHRLAQPIDDVEGDRPESGDSSVHRGSGSPRGMQCSGQGGPAGSRGDACVAPAHQFVMRDDRSPSRWPSTTLPMTR